MSIRHIDVIKNRYDNGGVRDGCWLRHKCIGSYQRFVLGPYPSGLVINEFIRLI